MDVSPLLPPDQKVIQSYSKGGFRISGEVMTGPVIVTATSVEAWQGITRLSADDAARFSSLKSIADVLLIGTGASAALLPPAVRQAFREQGFSVDVMDTGAACRTFNVLSAEGRRVAAALMPV